MDIQAVNSAGNPKVPPPKSQASSSSSGSKDVSATETKVTEDSVTLSTKAQALVDSNKGSSNSEQRKFSVTDDNDVVLQVIDPKTQKVVKSVPSEEQMQLKNAVRDGVSEITE
ncbi:MAG: hypothetical protein F3745_06625 [Nitrospinae bacterium]|nr:hypothetical protein [Nitrospinota bacterium]